jgi:hypothetical protein
MLTTTFCVRCSGRSNSSEVCPNCVRELDRLHDEAYDENLAWQDEAEYESEREYHEEEPKQVLYILRHFECEVAKVLGIFTSEGGAKSFADKARKHDPYLVGVEHAVQMPKWERIDFWGEERLNIGFFDGVRGSMLSIYKMEVDPEFKPRF